MVRSGRGEYRGALRSCGMSWCRYTMPLGNALEARGACALGSGRLCAPRVNQGRSKEHEDENATWQAQADKSVRFALTLEEVKLGCVARQQYFISCQYRMTKREY